MDKQEEKGAEWEIFEKPLVPITSYNSLCWASSKEEKTLFIQIKESISVSFLFFPKPLPFFPCLHLACVLVSTSFVRGRNIFTASFG